MAFQSSLSACILIAYCVSCCTGYGVPDHTRGQPWPMPAQMNTTAITAILRSDSFEFKVNGHDCDLMRGAFSRYNKIIFHAGTVGSQDTTLRYQSGNANGLLTSLVVYLTSPCEKYPSLEMDERYDLRVQAGSGAALYSNSIWGALRGLETFSQLVYQDASGAFTINDTMIADSPRFKHRGVLLDTSRHFLPRNAILASLEAMAYNKLNVFHWHIVDDPSFPYQSREFPELSKKGAYQGWSQSHTYTQLDVAEVIEFARQRGIRVMAEFDTPGHTQSWGRGLPGFLTPCYNKDGPTGNFGPVDPTQNTNYDFLKKFVAELKSVFPDHYLHLGGDEVSFSCWKSNPDITVFMNKSGFGEDYAKLENFYEQKLLDIVDAANSGYMVWQEVFDNGIKLRSDTVVHVWKGGWQKEMERVTKGKFKTLLSSPWYINYISYGRDWPHFYTVEPRNFNGTEEMKAMVMGGEACLWGEYVDSTNVEARLWPRASAVAERLWSPWHVNDVGKANPRMEEHRCRMLRRGIHAEPASGPNYCEFEYEPPSNPLWF